MREQSSTSDDQGYPGTDFEGITGGCMRAFYWSTSLCAIGLFLGSCATIPKATQSPSPAPQQVTVRPSPSPALTQPPPPPMKVIPVPGMLPPTVPTQRTAQVTTGGREDPFAQLPTPPIRLATAKPQANSQATAPSAKKAGSQSSAKAKPGAKAASGWQKPPSQTSAAPTQAPPQPQRSSTELAEAVEVTGVMQIRGKINIIVQMPNESGSFTVTQGDYLAGGKVRVKRIEIENRGEPLVVLEQNGIEVFKSVGRSVART